jgi:biotin carboxyl carrier protein
MNIERIRSLIDLFTAAPLTEFTVEEGGTRLHMRRGAGRSPQPVPDVPVATSLTPLLPVTEAVQPSTSDVLTVRALLPGTLYLCPSPGEPPFVTVGSVVKAGQTVAIIEAMKSMNAIASPCAGTVVRVAATNEDVVDEGQVLIELRIDDAGRE